MMNVKWQVPLIVLSVLMLAAQAKAVSCSSSPLVLDLGGDGIRTTGLSFPVIFDLHGNGIPVITGWTVEEEEDAFLWMDLNGDGIVNGGRELFGDSTLNPIDNLVGDNGFRVLKSYDGQEFGGNGDGKMSDRDLSWPFLLLWTDWNHDGLSQSEEISSLHSNGVEEIELTYREEPDIDGCGNWHFLKSTFSQRIEAPWGSVVVHRAIEDLYFLYSQVSTSTNP